MYCECNKPPEGSGLKPCHPSLEQQAKAISLGLKGNSKKMMRLLIKQFPLLSISVLEEPILHGEFIVEKHKEVKLHYGNGFVWIIPNEDIIEFNH